MSHFSVGVFIEPKKGKKLEDLLAPYQGNNMGNCPKEYLEFFECSEEIEEYEKYSNNNFMKLDIKSFGYGVLTATAMISAAIFIIKEGV